MRTTAKPTGRSSPGDDTSIMCRLCRATDVGDSTEVLRRVRGRLIPNALRFSEAVPNVGVGEDIFRV